MACTDPLFSRRQLLHLLGLTGTACAAAPLFSGCAVDPVTGRKQFVVMSEQEEISIDQQQSPVQFSTDYGAIQDPQLNQYIDKVGKELSARSHRPHMPFSFRGVNASYINAYAFPGGSIAVTRGILVELENEAELAALLGHEIGHICARHTAEQSSKGMISSILVAGASIASSAAGYSSAGNLISNFGQLGAGALLAHYSRDNEREADSLGMQYMTRTGYNPSGMVGLMEILLDNNKRKPSAVEVMFSTHPMSDERLAFAQNASEQIYGAYKTAPLNRERFMDMTASLRKQKDAINLIQQGATALAKEQYQEADQSLEKALQQLPNDYAALVMLAKSQLGQNRTTQAARLAMKATKVYPEEPQAHLVIGVSEIANKHYAPAYEHLSEFDTLLPGNPQITFFRGVAMEGMENKPQAAQLYTAYLKHTTTGDKAKYAYNRLKSWGYIK